MPDSLRRPALLVLLLVAVTLAAGVAANLFWLARLDGLEAARPQLARTLGALAVTLVVSLLNIALRWVRWHFLTRRVGIELAARDSAVIYTATLPALLTPLAVGELLRAFLLGRRHPGHTGDLVAIWLLERSSDGLLLALFLLAARGQGVPFGLLLALWLGVVFGTAAWYRRRRGVGFPGPVALGLLLVSTGAAWALPGIALWIDLRLLGGALALREAVAVFSQATLLGGFTGAPMGIGATGSSMLVQLQGLGLAPVVAALATAVLRAGTAWFAVALGVLVLWLYRGRLRALFRARPAAGHFDAIAEGYAGEIPTHVRDRLLLRKVRLMDAQLRPEPAAASGRGLDLGCGQGWYACEMARLGHRMHAVDRSPEQLARARDHARRESAPVRFAVSGADRLPFPEASFDFVYAVNVLHHVTDEAVRERTLAEIVRVLRPGGSFFLHEINTQNPLFRFYMGYVFPLLRSIDEGTERWLRPTRLPPVRGARWADEVEYFTFLPDFVPAPLLRALAGAERALERSALCTWSAHYLACLVKAGSPPEPRVPGSAAAGAASGG